MSDDLTIGQGFNSPSPTCGRCGESGPGYYAYIEGIGWRCGRCEAGWYEAMANWRGMSWTARTPAPPKRKVERQGVLL